jgi:hypothetical protein
VHCPNLRPIATQQLTRHHARVDIPSKRALHPIHNVKQPEVGSRKSEVKQLPTPITGFDFFLSREVNQLRPSVFCLLDGGAERDRTDDLLLAKQALSQLSYGPNQSSLARTGPELALAKLVGQGRFELPTSRLSSARSNQLSY